MSIWPIPPLETQPIPWASPDSAVCLSTQLGLWGDPVHTPGGLPTILASAPDPDAAHDHGGPVPVQFSRVG